jgi:hypothetical protein
MNARPIALPAAAIALAAALAACASSATGGASGAGPTGSSVSASVSSAPPSPAPSSARSSASSAATVTVSEAEAGTTLTVNRGADVVVTLHSTYWQFQQASAPKVLVQAAPVVQGDPPSRAGVPGSGKGTARETYHAQAAGTATITATRTSCGEAMRCTAGQGVYRITVVVR